MTPLLGLSWSYDELWMRRYDPKEQIFGLQWSLVDNARIPRAAIEQEIRTCRTEREFKARIMQVKTGGGALGTAIIRQGIEHATEPLGYKRVPIFQSSALEEAILLRGGANDGINIQVNRVVAHTALVDQWTAQVRWIEL